MMGANLDSKIPVVLSHTRKLSKGNPIHHLLPGPASPIPHPPSPFFEHCVASKTGLVTSIVVRSILPSPPPPPLLFLFPSAHLTTYSSRTPSTRSASPPCLAHLCVIGSCSQQQTTYHSDNTTLPSKPRRIVQLVRIPLASTVSSSAAPRPHPSELLHRQQSSVSP
jgi:hypothetical protein